MKEIVRAEGQVVFRLPDDASAPTDLPPERRARGGEAAERDELALLVEALTDPAVQAVPGRTDAGGGVRGGHEGDALPPDPDIAVVDAFAVELDGEGADGPRARGGTARAPAAPADALVDVSLASDEGAVLLLEQDGAYEWRFPESRSAPPAAGRARGGRARGGGEAPEGTLGPRTVTFRVPLGAGAGGESTRGGTARGTRSARGVLGDFVAGRIRGFILKYVVRKTVGALTRRLERGVVEGPVVIDAVEPGEDDADGPGWRQRAELGAIALPTERAARVLLLVHGTFSSTLGSFAALSRHDAGRRFLERALERYDLVLGYDHPTLSATPEENAEAIHAALATLPAADAGLEVDAIAFSRGCLVFRYLSEQVVPLGDASTRFDKAVFVGGTSAGTELANEENWKALVDLYTNIVAGAARLLGLATGAVVATRVFRHTVQTIGSLVTYAAEDAIADRSVPGLAAMRPNGDFVRALNAPPAAPRPPGAAAYHAIGSSFEPGRHEDGGDSLGERLRKRLADGLVDRLMGEDNDLVVDTDSMFVIDPAPAAKRVAHHLLEDNGRIYHTVYFAEPSVVDALGRWLDLGPATDDRGTRGAGIA